jgi:hypothetical protein
MYNNSFEVIFSIMTTGTAYNGTHNVHLLDISQSFKHKTLNTIWKLALIRISYYPRVVSLHKFIYFHSSSSSSLFARGITALTRSSKAFAPASGSISVCTPTYEYMEICTQNYHNLSEFFKWKWKNGKQNIEYMHMRRKQVGSSLIFDVIR